jgi:hypothetical protein
MRAATVIAACPGVDAEDLATFGDSYKLKYGTAGLKRALDALLTRKSREAGDCLLLALLGHPETPTALLSACTSACRCRGVPMGKPPPVEIPDLLSVVPGSPPTEDDPEEDPGSPEEDQGSPVDPPTSDDEVASEDPAACVEAFRRVVGELRDASLEVRQLLAVLRQYRVALTPALADMANTAKILAGVKDALGEQTEAMGEKIEQMSELTPPSALKRVPNIVSEPTTRGGVVVGVAKLDTEAVPIIRRPARRI